jgi:4-hydroxybenzoate polyprenyltransferase/phosphoserine phosphatase
VTTAADKLIPKGDAGLPLCVDLDGTLVKTDLLIEALFKLAKQKPLAALQTPLWLLRGKAYFKEQVFGRVAIDVSLLPYNEDFLAYLRSERQSGRTLILTTATVRPVAEDVAKHLGIFERVVASDATRNLAGRRKAEVLVQEFGARKFSYAANAYVDLSVWREAAAAHVVQPAPGLTKLVEAVCPVEAVYDTRKSSLLLLVKAMRVHQWAKNLLIFAPLVFAHRFTDPRLVLICLLAFVAFSLTSSSVYLINDLLDLDSDRRHPEKRRRPFASGDMPLVHGLVLAPVLLAGGMALGLALSPAFLAVLAGYFVITSAYSLRLKQIVLADVLVLACLYSWRVFAGSIATGIPTSRWLLAFLIFLFMSLAMVKRVSELILTIKKNLPDNESRGYVKADLPQLVSMGAASGYIAVLVLALYINDDLTRALYERPDALWLVCPLFLYWVSWMWLIAHRGKMHSDPLVFAMKDRVSYLVILAMAVVWGLASGRFF